MNITEVHGSELTEGDKFFYAGEAYQCAGDIKTKVLQYIIPAVQLECFVTYTEEVLVRSSRIALIHASASEMLWRIND